MSSRAFRCDYRVPYNLCTLGNHVYYSRYLDILEAARGEFFRQLGQPFLALQERDTIFPVIECRLRYLSPARYDDLLTVELWLTEAKGVRLSFASRILNQQGRALVEGETRHVCTSLQDQPKRLPEDLAAALRPYLAAPAPAAPPTGA